MGYSPRGRKESDTAGNTHTHKSIHSWEHTHTHTSIHSVTLVQIIADVCAGKPKGQFLDVPYWNYAALSTANQPPFPP